jgi:hypothetical protein
MSWTENNRNEALKNGLLHVFGLLIISLIFIFHKYSLASHAGGVPIGKLAQANEFVYFGHTPQAIQVSGNFAYVPTHYSYYDTRINKYVVRPGALHVFDILKLQDPKLADISAPVPLVGQAQISATSPTDIQLVGNYAYIVGSGAMVQQNSLGSYPTNVTNFLDIFDIQTPTAPKKVGSVKTDIGPTSVFVSGNYTFITNAAANTLQIFNISDPAKPQAVSSVNTGANTEPSDAYVSGNYAYVVTRKGKNLQVFDIADKQNPVQINTIDIGFPAWSIDVSDQFAYVGGQSSLVGTLKIFDISDPKNPVEKGSAVGPSGLSSITPEGQIGGYTISKIKVLGNFVYAAVAGSVQMFDVVDPSKPKYICGSSGNGATFFDVAGNKIYRTTVGLAHTWPTYPYTVTGQINIYSPCAPGAITPPPPPAPAPASMPTLTPTEIQTPIAGTTALNPIIAGLIETGINPSAIAISGTYAFVTNSENNTLEIYDCSNPKKPVLIATIATDANPQSISISGQYAYVANEGSDTIQVFYVGYPRSPKFVSRISSGFGAGTGRRLSKMHVRGRYGYAINRRARQLKIFNFGNPGRPILTGSIATDQEPSSVFSSGRYVYVTSYTAGTLQIFDVANPVSPQLINSVPTAAQPQALAVEGNFAYVASESNKLQVFNIADPASPILLSTVPTDANPQSVFVYGPLVYVTNYDSGTLQVFSVTDPKNPILVGSTGIGKNPIAVTGACHILYTVSDNPVNTLQTLNIFSAENKPTILSTAPTSQLPQDLAISGQNAFVANISGTLQSFNISNPLKPVAAGSAQTSQDARSVAISDPYAYVVSWKTNTLEVFDIADPNNPKKIGAVETVPGPWAVAVSSPYAFVLGYNSNQLQIFDLTNPANPVSVGSATTAPGPFALYAENPYVYVTSLGTKDTPSVLQTFDISNPNQPVITGSVETNQGPRAIDVEGPHAFVTSWDTNTLQVFDISNPINPVLRGQVNTGAQPRDVAVSGQLVYVANKGSGNIQVFTASDPTQPQLIAVANTGSGPRSVAVNGPFAYVANTDSNSLSVFSLSDVQPALEAIAAQLPVTETISPPVSITPESSLPAPAPLLPVPEPAPLIKETPATTEKVPTAPEEAPATATKKTLPTAEIPVTTAEPAPALIPSPSPATTLIPPLTPTTQPTDIIPPAAITDLKLFNPTATSLELSCTAPGDDGNSGTATNYDIRYSTSPITEENWNEAFQVTGEPAPQPAGSKETITIKNLNPATRYYVAIKTSDEVPNVSGLSNVPDLETLNPLTETAQTTAKFAETAAQITKQTANKKIIGSLLENHDLQKLPLPSPAEQARLIAEQTLAVANAANQTAQAALKTVQVAAEIANSPESQTALETINNVVATLKDILAKINAAAEEIENVEQDFQALEFSILNSDLMGPAPGTISPEQFNETVKSVLATAQDTLLSTENLLVKTKGAINAAQDFVDAAETPSETQSANAALRAAEAATAAANAVLDSVTAVTDQVRNIAQEAEALAQAEAAKTQEESKIAEIKVAEIKKGPFASDLAGPSLIPPEFSVLKSDLITPPVKKVSRFMTGGGTIGKTDTTHGFELHCDVNELPNNLEINWNKRGRTSDKFHLESLTAVTCLDDPNLNPLPRPADFDTLIATGTGRLNNIAGATIELTFTDDGEPGKNDFAKVLIKDVNGNVVLDVSGNLQFGNHQAH